MIRLRHLLLVAPLLLASMHAAEAPALVADSPALQGDAGRPAPARWQRTELYFATGPAGGPGVTAAQWQEFLDTEVTPRFPDGLTVLDAYGQWRASPSTPVERLASKVIVILHEDTPQRSADLDAVRLAWKRRTGDQSVLRGTQPVQVSF